MATADIAKLAVYDSRITQKPAAYGVVRGAVANTSAPFSSISATASQITFQVNVPSQTVFVDRAIEWTGEVDIRFDVTIGNSALANAAANNVNVPVFVFGRDGAFAPFPLNSLVGTSTATINDTSVTANTENIIQELLRLTDYKKNRLVRTCPTMLDTVADYSASPAAINSIFADYLDQTDHANAPNGAWSHWKWLNPVDGSELAGAGTYTVAGYAAVPYANGIPGHRSAGGSVVNGVYPLCVRLRSTEKLLLSPFVFADAHEWETGLFGVNNIQLVLNLKASPSRVIRCCPNAMPGAGGAPRSCAITSTAYSTATASPWNTCRLNVTTLTPSLDLPLPSKSVVSYAEYPRYLQNLTGSFAAGSTTSVQSQNIVLPQCPDMLIIYCKPASLTPEQGDHYLPITGISLNWDNTAGILSTATPEILYSISTHNGLDMDFNSWRGVGARKLANTTAGATASADPKLQTNGGFLVLRLGTDIPVQTGVAPGVIGNFNLQFTAQVLNPSTAAVNAPVLYTIAVNTGFFETLAGSSRIVKSVLSESDVLSAEPAPAGTVDDLARVVGGGFMDKLSSFMSKAKQVYDATKPAVSAIRSAMPEGSVRSALGAVGYGRAGGGQAGGGQAGGGQAGGARMMSRRLM